MNTINKIQVEMTQSTWRCSRKVVETVSHLKSLALKIYKKLESCHNCKANEHDLGPVKRICVFEHSVMTNFNCACPVIQRGQGSGFLSEGSS